MAQRNVLKENLAESARVVRERIGDRRLEVGMILGSGLGPLAERIEDAVYVPYGEVPHMRTSTATSHVGRFVCGMLGGKRVLAMQGRLHGYEGNTAQEVAYPVWLMHELGVDTLFATNAAGAINESYRVGDFCIIEDHINFTGRNPVAGLEPDGIAFRFFSMLDAYDPRCVAWRARPPTSWASACRRACTWGCSARASRRRPRYAPSAPGVPIRWP